MMEAPGIPSTRWFDAAMLPKDQVEQQDNLKAMMIFGHGGNTVTRMPEAAKGLEKLELLVVADPHPTTCAVLGERKNGTYLLPICTQFECDGSRTASNRSLQWGEQVVKPIFESKNDYDVMYLLAKKLGFADRMFKNIKVENGCRVGRGHPARDQPRRLVDRLYRPVAGAAEGCTWRTRQDFDLVTLRAPRTAPARATTTACRGRAGARRSSSIPAPTCSTTPTCTSWTAAAPSAPASAWSAEDKLPDGTSRKVNLLAEGSYSLGSEIKDGYPEFTYGVLKKLGWDKRPDGPRRWPSSSASAATTSTACPGRPTCPAASCASRMEHGCIHYGNGKARADAWNLPDPVPVHREPIYTPRPELVAKYPTRPDAGAVPHAEHRLHGAEGAVDKGIAKEFPIILTSGRLVEYEGGGEETRSNKWLAELQQDMFVEINPADAAERGIKDGAWV